MKQMFTKLFLALFALVMSANLAMAQVNMDRYIELTVQQGAVIGLNLYADEENTEIKVVCGAYDTTIVVGTSGTNFVTESTQATTMRVYGNVYAFLCNFHGENVTELDASNNTGLVVLYCVGNNLSSLDVSGLTVLEDLQCDENNLSFLDVSGLTALKVLCCSGNNLSSLDVSGLTALENLECWDNNLSSLDVSGLTALKKIFCYSNNFSACALDSLFHQLPRRSLGNEGEIHIKNGTFTNPGALTCRDTIATNRHWKVLDVNEGDAIPIVNENYECPYFTLGIEELIVNNINARVYPNPVSNNLNIECEENINKLEFYDAFGRIVISQESVQNNSSIDVSSLANGIYVLKLRTAEGVGEYKVVKD